MPWQVIRDGPILSVRISAPVGDWDRLALAIDEQLEPLPNVVTLPVTIPDGTAEDLRLLRITWDDLIGRGIIIYRETGEPSIPEQITVERSGSLFRWVCASCREHIDRWYVSPGGAEIAGSEHFHALHGSVRGVQDPDPAGEV